MRNKPVTVKVRPCPDGTVDEVVIPQLDFHLERMDTNRFWLGIGCWHLHATLTPQGVEWSYDSDLPDDDMIVQKIQLKKPKKARAAKP